MTAQPICQSSLPYLPWMDPRTSRLPGILPVEDDDWLRVDDAFAGQMARRDELLTQSPDLVHAMLPKAEPAARELFAMVLAHLATRTDYRVTPDQVTRPDGVVVPLTEDQPLAVLGRLVQEDFCLMEQSGSEHHLNGAVLCFPASWTLSQKIGKPMTAIHTPVTPYTEDVARRVQRLFDAIRVGQPLWRMNYLTYDDPELHQPRREGEARPRPEQHRFVRCERQVMRRLPQTGTVVFSIHTYQVRASAVPSGALEKLMLHGG